MRFLLLLFLVFSQFLASAQQVRQVFRKLTVDQGLSHTDATDIVQDEKGLIWIATLSGLNRYDGHEMKPYTSDLQQFNNVYLNRINKLSLRGHSIFMATQGGLAEFNLDTERVNTFESSDTTVNALIDESLSYVLAWKESLVWIIHKNKPRLLQIDRSTHQINEVKLPGLANFQAASLAEDASGAVWIGGQDGLLRVTRSAASFKTKRLILLAEDGRAFDDISALSIDKNQIIAGGTSQVWIGTFSDNKTGSLAGQVLKFDPRQFSNDPQKPTAVTSIVSRQNKIWLGTPEGMLSLERKDRAYSFTKPPYLATLSSQHISNLFTDSSGCLWVTTYGGGVNLLDLDPKLFHTLSFEGIVKASGNNPNYIRAILEDDQTGNLWVGTRNTGLLYYDARTNTTRQFLHDPFSTNSLISNNIRSLSKDKKGRIWVGTEAGISILDKGKFRHLISQENDPKTLTHDVIYTLGVDVFGQVWAGSWNNGLNRISENDGQFDIERIYEGKKGLSSQKVTYIYADPLRPEVLVGTSKGLDHIFLDSGGGIERILHYQGSAAYPKSISSNFIWPIVRADERTIWAGTIGGGLNKITLLDNGDYEAESFTTKDGLPTNDVEGLLLDNQGNLWVAGKGISMFNPRTKEFINYDQNDGLQSNVFKIGAAAKGRDGALYFGGVNGINYFFPRQIRRSSFTPNVVMTDILVNNKLVKPQGEILPSAVRNLDHIALNYLQNNLNIKFSALDFANPDKCRYRYRLVGFDEAWLETDSRSPQASYANLDYGDYTFQLLATNHDGIWTKNPVELKITVSPPWWKSTMAKIIYALLILGLLWLLYQYQVRWFTMKRKMEVKEVEERKSEEIHQMRLQFFTNISHELRTPLSLIISPVEKLLHEGMNEETRQKYYQLIHRNSSRLLTLVNELMDFRKAEAGVTKLRASETYLAPFLSEICSEFEEAAREKSIDFAVNLPDADASLWLDRGIIEKVLVNVLSNAFKYTLNNGTISLDLVEGDEATFRHSYRIGEADSEQDYAWIRVLDSGIGIPTNSLDHVFERYYRVTEAEKDKLLGSGIGLALVRSLILLHKGIIKVSSEVGEGTEFLIGIPHGHEHFSPEEIISVPDYQLDDSSIKAIETRQFLQEEFDARPAVTEESNSSVLKKLLIVEDNEEMRNFLADSFLGQYQVLTATDGVEGLGIAEEELPDLIVSDLMMPNMDGITFCQKIKDNLDTSHTPVVLLTAKNADESKIEGSEVGADAYLTKPFSLKLLQLTLHNLLEGRRKLKELYAHDALVEAREVGTTKRDKEFIDEIITIIEENLDNTELEVEHIARQVGMSRSKLYTKMHSLTGQTVGDFVRKLRMKRAAQMIVCEDMSITEIMDQVGIQSQSYFTKAFKKEFGKTPTQYLHDFIVENELRSSI